MINEFKEWLFESDFFNKQRSNLYSYAKKYGSMDAFEKAREDLEETRIDDTEERAEELATDKLTKLLSPVDWKHIVTVDKTNKFLYIGGERADDGRLNNLKAEAEALTQMELWKLLHETPKELAQKRMFVDALTIDDLRSGKSILYTLSNQKNIVDMLKSYNSPKTGGK